MDHGQAVIHSFLRLRWLMSAAAFEAKAEQLARALKAGFDPNQPRVPAGSPNGGQWASGDASSSAAGTSNEMPSGGPLRITVRPRGIEDNSGPPPELPPVIPAHRPSTRQDENRVARSAVRWLARAALRQAMGPVGTYLTIIEAAAWLHEHLPNMQSYLDGPKTLDELRDAVQELKKGYDVHHIVEQGPAERAGFPRSMIDA